MSLLGRDITSNKDIEIEQGHRTRGAYIIGATGSGKSVLTEQLAVQDAKDGLGFCVLDPHGDLINNIMVRIPKEREKDVILLDPTDTSWPFGLNLFSCTDPTDPLSVELSVNQITHVFEKIFGMSKETPRLSQFVRQIAYTFVGTGYTMCEIPYLLLDKPFRDRVVANVSSSQSKLFWRSYDALREQERLEHSESTRDRIDSLVSNSIIRDIVGQSRTTIDFRSCMDSGKILLVSLYAQLDAMTDLLGSIIIGQILLAALSRADTTKRRQFNLYADEFQRFCTPDMGTLLVEARKYGIATTVAHQVRDQLDEENQSKVLQAGALVVFRVNSTDAEDLAAEFNTAPPQAIKPPGTVPADILNHLTDHPHEDVKFFWTTYVKRLLEAKTMQPENRLAEYFNMNYEDKPYPYFFMDNAKIFFDPELGRQLLDYLQQLFYNSSNHRGENAELMKEALGLFVQMINQIPPIIQRDKYFNLFADDLKYALYEVWQTPIETTTTEWQYNLLTQQSHADRKAQIANQLTHLDIGQAKVKVPKWDKDAKKVVLVEHTIRTIPADTDKKLLALAPQIRQKYLEQTRREYCRPRADVEEEIRLRTEPPAPSSTRRDSI